MFFEENKADEAVIVDVGKYIVVWSLVGDTVVITAIIFVEGLQVEGLEVENNEVDFMFTVNGLKLVDGI